MKTSLTKLSSSLLLVSFALPLWGKPVAQVIDLTGTVFAVNSDGKTVAIKLNQHIEDKTEILVEEGASITLNDYYDATYHLIGGSHLKFFNKSVQLKKGKSWVQSMNSRHPLALTTANGHVDFWKGEFIATFDQASNRTQVLVVNGEVGVSNILNKTFKFSIPAGSFSMIDPEQESGNPRTPTQVGFQSLQTALSEFKKLPEKILSPGPETGPVREIASVEGVKKGEIIFIKTNRIPASVNSGEAHKYYKKIVSKKIIPSPQITVNIYGMAWKKTEAEVVSPRTPASIPKIEPRQSNVPSVQFKNDPEFSRSLKNQESVQPKHPKELQNLIDDLKSF